MFVIMIMAFSFFLFFAKRNLSHISFYGSCFFLFVCFLGFHPHNNHDAIFSLRGAEQCSVWREKVVQTKSFANVRSDIFILSGAEKKTVSQATVATKTLLPS